MVVEKCDRAVKVGEVMAELDTKLEPDAKAEPLLDTVGAPEALVVAEGVHVPPHPMYLLSALTQFQFETTSRTGSYTSGSQRAM